MKIEPLRLPGAKLPFRNDRRVDPEVLCKFPLRQATGLPRAAQLGRHGFVRWARIVSEEFEDCRESPKSRTGRVFLPVGDGVGANVDQFGHVLLKQASLQPSSANVVTQGVQFRRIPENLRFFGS